MANRDDFPSLVRRKLAERAGFKCSVCGKPTIGPGNDQFSVISDGVAAHVTAAAPKGPRFDPTLSNEQRSGIENGIWTCTQHGHEIDTDVNAFSIELLLGLKKQRENLAKQELEFRQKTEDRSAIMIEIPYVQTTFQLFEIVSPQKYNRAITSSLSDFICLSNQSSHILDLASEVIISTWETHPNVAGILSTILSNNIVSWNPSEITILQLQELCNKAINSDDWSQVASVEPLAFAISGKGYTSIHRKVLERLISSSSWREADADRVKKYYGSLGNEIAAIIRHWNDHFRYGLLKINDIGRLIDLLMSNNEILKSGPGRTSLLKLLHDHAIMLHNSGESVVGT